MTLEGWIFMVGLRVFDVGALIVWMVWFFRLKNDDEDDSSDGDDFRRQGADEPVDPPPSAGPPDPLELPRPDADPWPSRRRDHGGDRPPAPVPARRSTPRPVRREPVRR